jgi:hypothetical protein
MGGANPLAQPFPAVGGNGTVRNIVKAVPLMRLSSPSIRALLDSKLKPQESLRIKVNSPVVLSRVSSLRFEELVGKTVAFSGALTLLR